MAMTPWHTQHAYSLEQAACLLAGEDPTAYELSGWELPEVIAWKWKLEEASARLYEHEVLVHKVGIFEIQETVPAQLSVSIPSQWEAPRIDLASCLWAHGFEIRPGAGRGIRSKDGQTIREPDDGGDSSEILFMITRRELQRWLRHSGFADRDMPEALQLSAEEEVVAPAGEELPSSLVTIAALLDLLKDASRPRYNQAGIIQAIGERHQTRGLSESQLQKLFAAANKAASDAAKSL